MTHATTDCSGRCRVSINDVIQVSDWLLRHTDYVMLNTLCGVGHAYGFKVASLWYLVIPWVFSCSAVCHVVIRF